MSPDEALRYLYSLQASGLKFGLENTRRALSALGHPEAGLACIHVGGTNGKGSVCTMLAALLSRHNLKTGLYTSPHLTDFRERIQVDGRWLAQGRLPQLVRQVREAARGIPLTFFEFATVMALLQFAEAGVEAAVLEVGMGGRLDATNVVAPLAAVITNVSREHTAYLGRRLAQIAVEKAGIIKPGVPCLTGAGGVALGVIEGRCNELGAPLYRLGRELRVRVREGGRLDYQGVNIGLKGLELGLLGRHQAANAALALGAAEVALPGLGVALNDGAVRSALREVRWPGRLERLTEAPALLLDGAHNPAGARTLAAYLATPLAIHLAAHSPGRLTLVVGMLKDKDAAGILRPLLPLASRIVACAPQSERALPAPALAERVRALNGQARVEVAASVAAAVDAALGAADPQDTVCVTGSLFTVGEARAHWLAATGTAAAC